MDGVLNDALADRVIINVNNDGQMALVYYISLKSLEVGGPEINLANAWLKLTRNFACESKRSGEGLFTHFFFTNLLSGTFHMGLFILDGTF